jgi:hypothetical protein
MAQMSESKFSNSKDDGSVFGAELLKVMKNTELSPKSQIALNELYKLVEKKLRKDTGASINS